LFKPIEKQIDRMWCTAHNIRPYLQADIEAANMRKAIVNDSLPYEMRLIQDSLITGGRIMDAMLLGMIRYHEALPELVEAAAHDTNEDMKYQCLSSIGEMRERATPYTHFLCDFLKYQGDSFLRSVAAEQLGKIRDKRAIATLASVVEESMELVQNLEHKHFSNPEDRKTFDDLCSAISLLKDSLESLYKLNPNLSRDFFEKGVRHPSPTVSNFSQSALFMSDYQAVHSFKESGYALVFRPTRAESSLLIENSHPQ